MTVTVDASDAEIDGRLLASITVSYPREATEHMPVRTYNDKRDAIRNAVRKAIKQSEHELNHNLQQQLDKILPGGRVQYSVAYLSM